MDADMGKVMDFLSMVAEGIAGAQASTAGVSLAIGILNCFLGYRLLKAWVSLTGFTLGAMAGYAFFSHYTRSSLVQIGAILVCGLILGMAAFYFYQLGVFLLCTNVSTVAASILMQPKDSLEFMVCLGIGVLIGLLAMSFVKPMVIFHTALAGGFSVAASLAGIWHKEADVKILILGAGLAVAGIILQAATAPGKIRKKERIRKDD